MLRIEFITDESRSFHRRFGRQCGESLLCACVTGSATYGQSCQRRSVRLQTGKAGGEGKKFAFVLIHDVESSAGLSNCRSLAQLAMELGFRSSFNFVPEGNYRVPAELRDELTARGFEIGIHDLRHDGHLFSSYRGFKRRAERINRYAREWGVAGFRSGFMLRNLDWLHDLDVQYDASTFDTDPFEPQPDGRHTIFPFWVPRPNDNCPVAR